ncbi:BAS1 [Candida pseudojiufengensis]|uniref:BAS1 n=1 Tax=Candida pseudojiufengensis TaxID=497109 RepID=UPI002224ADB1|nr:BAS1 [Candida pseudojiufengensis]KAI5965837.1 BAS1 [Candida pseudojiufengensis]
MNQTDNTKSSRKRVVPIDPLAVTESLGFQTFRKGARKPWTKEEDAELSRLLQVELSQNNNNIDSVDWDKISDLLSSDGSRKSKDCRKRWSNSLDPALRKGKWTTEEDEMLVRAFEKFGTSWLKVAQEIEGRTDDQCAKRYMEVLDPKTKDRLKPWTQEEDLLLIKQVKLYGTKWRTVCSAFESRPSLTCRNRWRKLVTEVVRGKADPIIKREVENVTNGNSSEVLENLTRQQEELSKSYDDSDAARKVKRRKLEPNNNIKTEVEWLYQLNSKSTDAEFKSEKSKVGAIKDRETAQLLVDYARSNSLSIVIHQHVHHHYSSNSGRDSGTPGSIVEPEEQMSRFLHFNYLPPMTQVPKLNSSAPNVFTDATTTQHHHHHHHHHHHQDSPSENLLNSKTEEANRGESDLLRLLNTDDQNENRSDSNAMTPLTQAVELATAAENSKFKTGNNSKMRPSTVLGVTNQKLHEEEEDEEGLDFWETMRNLTEVPIHKNKIQQRNENFDVNHNFGHSSSAQNQMNVHQRHQMERQLSNQHRRVPVENQVTNQVQNHRYSQRRYEGQNQQPPEYQNQIENQFPGQKNFQNSEESKERPVSQHHPLHYQNSFTRESTPKKQQTQNTLLNDEELDEEDKILARELGETGLDQELLNSYGLFYNVYTKEGSTFPETQPSQLTQEQVYQKNESVYDQWGSEYIIPFNPS